MDRIKTVIERHGKWLRGVAGGERADLQGSDLQGINLQGVDLQYSILHGAILQNSNLQYSNLQNSDLRGANLQGANLQGADLQGANLQGAILPHYKICPESGGFYGWKQTTTGIITVYIPAKSARVSCPHSRKCRAEFVKVMSGEGCGGSSPTHARSSLTYNKGETVYAEKFDDDIRVDCTGGIHFWMTEAEAREW